ncbi:heme exporter protein CcmD [Salicola sp. Rm-C-2C1-2]|uniref:heme exporter protein CcmD n=1 Tax=Salicola sp. Rm-C-2C1-2 TaxID=3141321 RepID=UPI0032E36D14
MQFDSFQALISMGGHGFYVWVSYGAFILVILALILATVIQRRQVISHHRRLMRSEAHRQGSGGKKHDASGS